MLKSLAVIHILMVCLLLFSGQSRSQDETTEETGPDINIGGALRLNYAWKDYDNDSNGSFDFELFRVDVDIKHDNWFLDVQYRWYKEFEAIHHAAIGYQHNDANTFTMGVTQVPFGIEPYASHSFWFSGAYYLGLEDDYDSGFKWRHKMDQWTFDAAYFLNSEYDRADRWDRYSFDVSSFYGEQRANKEEGQFNFRAQYELGEHKLGASLQSGRFKNVTSEDTGDHWALGVHFDGHFDHDWNIQAQFIQYQYETAESLGTADNRIALSAFEFPFEIATKAQVSVLNVAKKFNFNNKFADSITCYNDSTFIKAPNRTGLTDSIQNVTGCMVAKGGLYTYIDWIAGKNMWFAGGPGIGIDDGSARWHSRLNINFGYYF